jgi:hypothetical protein
MRQPAVKKLVIGLVVLGVILAVVLAGLAYADVQVREYAEEQAERQLVAAVPSAGGADVEIDAFPFVGRVLLDGSVRELDVELTDLKTGKIAVERVAMKVEGLKIDRDQLLGDRKLVVLGLQKASVDATITSAAVNAVTPVTTRLRNGKVEVTYQGHTVEGKLKVRGRDVVIDVAGVQELRVPLPDEQYLPCTPDVKVDGDRLRVTCTIHELPKAVAAVLGK